MNRLLWTVLLTQLVALVILAFLLFELEWVARYSIYLVCASIFVLYLPGYRWSCVFFDREASTGFERFVMSLALSLWLITLISYYARYVGIVISPMFVFVVSVLLIGIAYLLLLVMKRDY